MRALQRFCFVLLFCLFVFSATQVPTILRFIFKSDEYLFPLTVDLKQENVCQQITVKSS